MPTPILRASLPLNLQSLATPPQPKILLRHATSTKHTENNRSFRSIVSKDTLRPMPAKNTGAKTIYAEISILLST